MPTRVGKARGTPATNQALPTAVSPVAIRRATAIVVSATVRHRGGPAATRTAAMLVAPVSITVAMPVVAVLQSIGVMRVPATPTTIAAAIAAATRPPLADIHRSA